MWLSSIFPGLQYDSPFTVKLVLSTLEGRVIDNKDLSKTSKLYVFNTMSLTYLSELYNWNPKTWYDKKSNKMTTFKVSFFFSNNFKACFLNIIYILIMTPFIFLTVLGTN